MVVNRDEFIVFCCIEIVGVADITCDKFINIGVDDNAVSKLGVDIGRCSRKDGTDSAGDTIVGRSGSIRSNEIESSENLSSDSSDGGGGE